MKEKLIAVVLLLILTAILPIAVSKCSERSFAKPTVSTSDTPDTPDSNGGNDGVVQTGEAPLAVVILTLLIGSTCVMFVLRKKEEIL